MASADYVRRQGLPGGPQELSAHPLVVYAGAAARPGHRPAATPQRRVDRPAPEVPVHAVFASSRYLTPKVRAFSELAVARFRLAA